MMLVVKRLTGSLVDCLRLLHNERIIHCDFKPVRYLSTPTVSVLSQVTLPVTGNARTDQERSDGGGVYRYIPSQNRAK